MTDMTALIFDCDGVLVDSERIAISVERECLAEIGLRYETTAYLNRFVGLKDADFYAELELDCQALTGSALPVGFVESVRSRCWARFETELAAIDGVRVFLDGYDGALAVASSSTMDGLHKKLELTGLHHLFSPHIYSGQQVERGKPAPDLFLFAASRLDRVPGDCLVLEDSVNGVRAARSAGMKVWGFTGGGHADTDLGHRLSEAGAHNVVSSYAEFSSEFQGS